MSKLTKKDIEELKEFLSFGCDYSGTKEYVYDLVCDILTELGAGNIGGDDVGLIGISGEFAMLDDFVELFWERAVNGILNVVETQE